MTSKKVHGRELARVGVFLLLTGIFAILVEMMTQSSTSGNADAFTLLFSGGSLFNKALRLIYAFMLATLVVYRPSAKYVDSGVPNLKQSQILLCIAATLTIILIGNSVARAFTLVGAANLVRFRTPLKDPMDSAILFLLMGIGMACGLGLFSMAFVAVIILLMILYGVELKAFKMHQNQFKLSIITKNGLSAQNHVSSFLKSLDFDFFLTKKKIGTKTKLQYQVMVNSDFEDELDKITDSLQQKDPTVFEEVTWSHL